MFAKTLGINRFAKHCVLIAINPLTCVLGSRILGRRRPSTTTFFWRISRGFWYYRNKENMFYRSDFILSFKDFVVYDRFTLAFFYHFFCYFCCLRFFDRFLEDFLIFGITVMRIIHFIDLIFPLV